MEIDVNNKKIEVPMVAITEIYQNSLYKMSYLVRVIDFIKYPISVFMLTIIVYLMSIQIDIFLNARRRNYGVLMARGMSYKDILLIVYTQLSIIIIIGFVSSVLLSIGTKQILQEIFRSTNGYMLALRYLGLKEPAIMDYVPGWSVHELWQALSVTILDALGSTLIIGSLAMAITYVLLRRLPVGKRTVPMELITMS